MYLATEVFHCLPNDKKILEIDDIMYHYMYCSWMQKQEDEMKKMKNFGCFVGSFWNGEMARKIQDAEDGDKNRTLSDEEFQKTLDYVEDESNKLEAKRDLDNRYKKKKNKRLRINNGVR